MEHSPLVSIVVISYNHSNFIKENLDSIKAQTYPNIELIVGDDASTDNSVEVYEDWLLTNRYKAKKNYHKINTGLAVMLNECIEMAEGKYIKLIAADDFLHSESIEKCVHKLENLGEEYGMVFTDTYAIDENSKIIQDFTDFYSLANLSPIEFQQKLLQGNIIAALTVLMKLNVLKETGKYDAKYITEDYYRWLKINEKYFITYIPEKLAYYRQHDNNISKLKLDQIEFETFQLIMLFDKKGFAKNRLNQYFFTKYKNGLKINKELFKLYTKYPFRSKRLVFFISFKIPFFFFNIFNKYS